jgi:hypothetical protein
MSSPSTATARPFEFSRVSSDSLDPPYLPFLLPRTAFPIRHSIALAHHPKLSEIPHPTPPSTRPGLHGQRSSTCFANMVFDLSMARGRKISDCKLAHLPHFSPSKGSLATVVENDSPKRPATSQGLSMAGNLRRKISKKHSLPSLLSTPSPNEKSPMLRHRRTHKGSLSTHGSVPEDEVIIISPLGDDDGELSPRSAKEEFEARDYFLTRHRMKHHPYLREDAPYMQAYNPILLDKSVHVVLPLYLSAHVPPVTALQKRC